jgi:hypothetical protein
MALKIKQFSNVSRGEITDIVLKADHTITDLVIDNVMGEIADHGLIVVGLGDNAAPVAITIVDQLITAHNAGIPILFAHGFPSDFDTNMTISDKDKQVLSRITNELENNKLKTYINEFLKDVDTVFSSYWTKLETLGFLPNPISTYTYYTSASEKISHPALNTPFNINSSAGFEIQSTHDWGIKLVPGVTRLLINPSAPDTDANYFVAGWQPVGKGKIAYTQMGHNMGDSGNIWNSLSQKESQLFCNIISWLIELV